MNNPHCLFGYTIYTMWSWCSKGRPAQSRKKKKIKNHHAVRNFFFLNFDHHSVYMCIIYLQFKNSRWALWSQHGACRQCCILVICHDVNFGSGKYRTCSSYCSLPRPFCFVRTAEKLLASIKSLAKKLSITKTNHGRPKKDWCHLANRDKI